MSELAITDSKAQRHLARKPRKRSGAPAKGVPFSDNQKIEAVQTYLILGNLRMVSATLNISYGTLTMWKASDWWRSIENDLKLQDELQLSARLKKIAERSFEVVEDRLENGNFIYDQKTGKIRRVPVSLKDAHKVAIDSVEKRELIATRNVEKANDGEIISKLEQLALKFAEMAGQKIIQDENRTVEMADVVEEELKTEELEEQKINVEYSIPVVPHVEHENQETFLDLKLKNEVELAKKRKTNALHDEWKTRLQKGESALQLKAERTEEAQ